MTGRTVHMVTLGCTRNDVDSEEMAGRLASAGWRLVDDPRDADVAVVNTCGFIEQAKKDSIDAILEAGDAKDEGRTQAVVAVGCLAQRYGKRLAEELPEADAVLGFDSYADLSDHLTNILAGQAPASHEPGDRRTLLPLSPVDRSPAASEVAVPGHDAQVVRERLDQAPWAPLKIASGCDRRCSFCAIPSFRGSFVSRHPADIVAEAGWLAERGVKELFLVSENTTSYGKDLGDQGLLLTLVQQLAQVPGVERVRVSYLQPAEIRPGLIDGLIGTDKVMPWFDISFQHASGPLLRSMRRFGDAESFLTLIEQIRGLSEHAAIRSNVILGFPGESEEDVEILCDFLTRARLDIVGVFGYSDEDGTEGEAMEPKVAPNVIAERVERVRALADDVAAQRAMERIGHEVRILIEEVCDPEEGIAADLFGEPGQADAGADPAGAGEPFVVMGRAEHQGPDVDGCTYVLLPAGAAIAPVGATLTARVTGTDGIDLLARAQG